MTIESTIISRIKWYSIPIMLLAFPARWYISGYWGDIVMAFGLGAAISLGVADIICDVNIKRSNNEIYDNK